MLMVWSMLQYKALNAGAAQNVREIIIGSALNSRIVEQPSLYEMENNMQKRNPEQDKWIIQTELPYYRLPLVDPAATSHIAVLLADGNTHPNKYVVRKVNNRWGIPSKDERCIYPGQVYGIKEVVTQTPIPDIPWHLVDPLYTRAATDPHNSGRVFFYEEAPEFSHSSETWQVRSGRYTVSPLIHNLTGVVPALSLTSRPE